MDAPVEELVRPEEDRRDREGDPQQPERLVGGDGDGRLPLRDGDIAVRRRGHLSPAGNINGGMGHLNFLLPSPRAQIVCVAWSLVL
jgi:hypothetical protein